MSSVKDRKLLIRKDGKGFICLGKGHISKNCPNKVNCKQCNMGGHHVSLCDLNTLLDSGNVARNNVSPNLHVGSEYRVVLQTAQGLLRGANREARLRVMFDTGSHKSLVMSKTVKAAGLPVNRKEWLEITTLGKAMRDNQLRDVFELEIAPLKGSKSVKIEAFGVESIAQVANERVELHKGEYPHLRDLWFSDVSKSKDVFEIDVLIGSDYIWLLQNGKTVRREPNERFL